MPIEPTGSAENTRAFLTKTEMSNNRDITEKEHTMEQKPFTVRKLTEKDLCPNLLQNFDRYQQVERCWRKENDSWLLKDIAFTEQWSESEKQDIVTRIFTPVICQGGSVLGIFRPDGSLAAYAVVRPQRLGSRCQYLQLKELYVSRECRRMGLGKTLFEKAAAFAREQGAQKLYISAHSSEESQAFYRRLGCIEAEEYDERLAALEPCDCQMEYQL